MKLVIDGSKSESLWSFLVNTGGSSIVMVSFAIRLGRLGAESKNMNRIVIRLWAKCWLNSLVTFGVYFSVHESES